MDFQISQTEIQRRRFAFLSLLGSTFVGLILFSNFLQLDISRLFLLLIFSLFTIFYLLTSNYFAYLSKTKISIQKGFIERHNEKNTERFSISEIKEVGVKRRIDGHIREISLTFNDGKRIYVNTLEGNFEAFLKVINSNVRVTESKEPINYDSLLFYPALGLVISSVSTFMYDKIIRTDYSKVKLLFPAVSAYLFALGMYFLVMKPIASRSGKGIITADVIFGVCMMTASVFVLLLPILLGN